MTTMSQNPESPKSPKSPVATRLLRLPVATRLLRIPWKRPTVCAVTSVGFVLPFAMDGVHVPPVFQVMLVSQTIVAILFWWDPAISQNTVVHRIDAALARANVVSIISYKFFLGTADNMSEFLLAMFCMFLHFWLSHRVSSHQNHRGCGWGSSEHVAVHALAHLWCSRGVYLTFFMS